MKLKPAIRRLSAVLLPIAAMLVAAGCTDNMIVLDPKGPVGAHQKDLIIISTLLCLIVVVPVLLITVVIAWRYRDSKTNKAKYKPEWEHNTKLEVVWWTIPILIILTLAVITVRYTFMLEPSKPLASEKETMTIQVTSLDWKWLFYYPEQGIATINYIQFPEETPIRFELTSDAPMNSFWIPQLGGQIYTMSGMAMTLHLQADEPGQYYGSGANFSGKDFASMNFIAEATTREQFDQWVAGIKRTEPALTEEGYALLAAPGTAEVQSFSSFPEGLFERTVTKYAGGHQHGGHSVGGGKPEADKSGSGHEGHSSSAPSVTTQGKGDGHVGQH